MGFAFMVAAVAESQQGMRVTQVCVYLCIHRERERHTRESQQGMRVTQVCVYVCTRVCVRVCVCVCVCVYTYVYVLIENIHRNYMFNIDHHFEQAGGRCRAFGMAVAKVCVCMHTHTHTHTWHSGWRLQRYSQKYAYECYTSYSTQWL